MSHLLIDEEKCKRDGICAGECPIAIIQMADQNSIPEMVPGGEQACLLCGHCVSVCPHGALSLEKMPVSTCPEIDPDLIIDKAQAVQFLRSRRSVRLFKDKPVEAGVLQGLIETARYAPTASNAQPVEWTVFTDREKIKYLAGLTIDYMKWWQANDPDAAKLPYIPLIISAWDMGFDAVLRDAPAVIIASAPDTAASGMVDITLALSYLELAAQTVGIGTCWAGLLHGALRSWQPLKDAVALPEGHNHQYGLMVGYTKSKYFRLPERKTPTIHWR